MAAIKEPISPARLRELFDYDPATGELCRCRPDWAHPTGDRGVILVDVKTCGDASPREFGRQVARKGYHRQAAFYSDGYEIASGKRVLGFVFVAVESTWPFAASAPAALLANPSRHVGDVHHRALVGSDRHHPVVDELGHQRAILRERIALEVDRLFGARGRTAAFLGRSPRRLER